MVKQKKRLVLLDAHAIIHRAYHALPDFRNSEGEPTGALYGLITMILKIIDDFNPDYLVAAFDLPGKTFRHDAYEDYKGKRAETEDELKIQLQRARDVMTAFNIPIYDHTGFEADDMLGTIVEQTKNAKDLEVIIASGDMDTLQLVDNKHVQVFTLKRGIKDTILYDEDAVRERYGFGPELLPDYKGIRGDPSDNIIGIKGIGDKGATQLITTFGTIEEIYKALHENPEILKEKGVSARNIKLLSASEDDALFSKTLATIRRDAPIAFTIPEVSWREGFDIGAVGEICSEFEFRTLWVRLKGIFGVEEESIDEEEKHEDINPRDLEEIGIGLWLLNSEITRPTLEDIFQHTGVKTFSAAKQKILDELTEKNLDAVYREIELPIIDAVHAMTERGILLDLDYLSSLSKEYHQELTEHEKKIYQLAGTEFNIKSPKQLSKVLFDTMGLPTKGLKKTPGGVISTRESELEKLKDEHEIIDRILKYRELQKLLSTYIDNLPDMVHEDGRLHAEFLQAGTSTGRFASLNPNLQNIPIRSDHGIKIRNAFIAPKGHKLVAIDYSQIELRVAAILSKDPYLTDIFVSGKDVHAAVAARVFGVAEEDVDREMRRRAKIINFGVLYGMGINALKKNLGSTRAEAQEFHNKYFEQFSAIREYLDTTKAFAYEHGYTETLFGRRRYYPALKSKLPFIRAAAERTAINAPIQGTATADIVKLAIKHVTAKLRGTPVDDKVHLILQIHDELVFEIADDVLDNVVPSIVDTMEHVLENSFLHFTTKIPLKVNVGIGNNWGEMKE